MCPDFSGVQEASKREAEEKAEKSREILLQRRTQHPVPLPVGACSEFSALPIWPQTHTVKGFHTPAQNPHHPWLLLPDPGACRKCNRLTHIQVPCSKHSMKDLCSSGKIYLEGETGKVKLHKLYLRTTVRHTDGFSLSSMGAQLCQGVRD